MTSRPAESRFSLLFSIYLSISTSFLSPSIARNILFVSQSLYPVLYLCVPPFLSLSISCLSILLYFPTSYCLYFPLHLCISLSCSLPVYHATLLSIPPHFWSLSLYLSLCLYKFLSPFFFVSPCFLVPVSLSLDLSVSLSTLFTRFSVLFPLNFTLRPLHPPNSRVTQLTTRRQRERLE